MNRRDEALAAEVKGLVTQALLDIGAWPGETVELDRNTLRSVMSQIAWDAIHAADKHQSAH